MKNSTIENFTENREAKHLKPAQEISTFDKYRGKASILTAQLHPFSNAIMYMARGMSANPSFTTLTMAPFLAITRAILCNVLSVRRTILGLTATPVSRYYGVLHPFQKIDSQLNRETAINRLVYYNPTGEEELLSPKEKDDLFNAIVSKYHTREKQDIFDDLEKKNPSAITKQEIIIAQNILQLKTAILEINFSNGANQYQALINTLEMIDKISTKLNKILENKKKTIEPQQLNEKLQLGENNEQKAQDSNEKSEDPIERLARKIISKFNDENAFKKAKHALEAFKLYIKEIFDVIAKVKDESEKKEKRTSFAKKIFDFVLKSQLEDNAYDIKNKKQKALSYILNGFIYFLVAGNVVIFTAFTQQKGEKLIRSFFKIADKHLLFQSDNLHAFLNSPPKALLFITVALFFASNTLLISWYFSKDQFQFAVKKALSGKNPFIKAYEDNGEKSLFKKYGKFILFASATIISLFGSNMVFFNYIYNESIFSKMPITIKGYFLFGVFISTACFFITLYSIQGYSRFLKIKNRISKQMEGKNLFSGGFVLLMNLLIVAAITGSLTYVLVVSDITNAYNLFHDKSWFASNQLRLTLLLIAVGILTTLYNLVYSEKAIDHIHKKIATFPDKVSMSFAAIPIILSLVFISIPSKFGALSFELVIATALVGVIGYLIIHQFTSTQNNAGNNQTKHLLRKSYILALSYILCIEAVAVQQGYVSPARVEKLYSFFITIISFALVEYIGWKLSNALLFRVDNESSTRSKMAFGLFCIFNAFLVLSIYPFAHIDRFTYTLLGAATFIGILLANCYAKPDKSLLGGNLVTKNAQNEEDKSATNQSPNVEIL